MQRNVARTLYFVMLGMALAGVSAGGQSVMYTADTIQWTDGPASLPKGAKMAVIKGDPTQQGLFTMRLKFPSNYKVQPHFHPADEHVTVISGKMRIGMGDTFHESQGKELSAGSFMAMPAQTRHFAWTEAETVIQLHGMGPWGITYVNAGDDPRQKQTSSR